MGFIDEIKAKAKTCKKTIVLPETEDIRTYEAAEAVLKEGTANLILVGSEEEIAKNKGDFDISGATIVDPATSEKTEGYIAKLVELRQKKGMTEEQARELLLTNYLYYGVMMVKMRRCGRNGIRCLPLYGRHPETLPADPEDQAGDKAGIRFLRDRSARLRHGRGRNLYLRGFRSGAESGSGETGGHRSFFRRFFPPSHRQGTDRGNAVPFHQGKRKASGCGQSGRGYQDREGERAGRPAAGRRVPA